MTPLICIECCTRLETREQAWKHCNPKVSKDSTVTRALPKHVVFLVTGKVAN
jgi:hypothetical protein